MSADTARLIARARTAPPVPWQAGELLVALADALEAATDELSEYSTDVGYAAGYEAARERAEAAETQRDTLAAALRTIAGADGSRRGKWPTEDWASEIARAALAAVAPPEEHIPDQEVHPALATRIPDVPGSRGGGCDRRESNG